MAELVGYMLTQQPINPIKKIPAEITSLPAHQQEKAHDIYMERVLKQTMENHTRTLVADLLNHLYGDSTDFLREPAKAAQFKNDSERLYLLGSQMIERMYMDHQVGQTRYIGRALAALNARQAEIRNTEAVTYKMMKEAVASYGLTLENYLGDTLHYKDAKGKMLQIPVKTMDYVLTRNINPESATIPWGAQPHLDLLQNAKKNGLVGNPLAGLLYLDESAVKDGYGTLDEMKDRAFYERFNKGFSHVGAAIVKTVPYSKVKMTWVVDSYPHPLADAGEPLPEGVKGNAGGTRYVGVEQFLMESTHSRFMIASIDPVMLHTMIMDGVAQNGIPKKGDNLFPHAMHQFKYDANLNPVVVEDLTKLEKAKNVVALENDVLQDLYTEKNPHRFYKKFTDQFEKYAKNSIREGEIFLWITPSGIMGAGSNFCSLLIEKIATKLGTNLEIHRSRWIGLIFFLDKLATWGQKKNIKLFMSPDVLNIQKMARMPIVAPSSLAAQKYVTKHYDLEMEFSSIRKRTQADFASNRAAHSKAYAELAEKFLPRSKFNQFSSDNLDLTEVRAYAHMVDKAGTVARGFAKVKTTIRDSIAWLRGAQDAESKRLFGQLMDSLNEGKATPPPARTELAPTQNKPSLQRAAIISCARAHAQ
jgi:hypothetical protein